MRANVWQAALPPLYLAASNLSVLFILWFGGKNVLGTGWRSWDIAAFTTFLSCFTKLVVKSSKVAKLFNSVQKAEVSWKRIKPLMKQPEQLEALHIPAAQDVTLENLSFSYGEGPIFSGLSLTGADTEVVLTAMDQLIRGMSTAFLTSIVGVCGSLLFNLLNNRATDKCQKAIDRFCEVFSLYAMPKPVSEDTAMLALQQEQTAYIRQAVEDMSQKMAVQMEQSIMRAMLPVQRSMDNFILAATQAQVEGVTTAVAVFDSRTDKKDADFVEERRVRTAQTKEDTAQAILNVLAESKLGSMPSTQLRAEVVKETGCSDRTYIRAYGELVKSGEVVKKNLCQQDGRNQWYSFLHCGGTSGEVPIN